MKLISYTKNLIRAKNSNLIAINIDTIQLQRSIINTSIMQNSKLIVLTWGIKIHQIIQVLTLTTIIIAVTELITSKGHIFPQKNIIKSSVLMNKMKRDPEVRLKSRVKTVTIITFNISIIIILLPIINNNSLISFLAISMSMWMKNQPISQRNNIKNVIRAWRSTEEANRNRHHHKHLHSTTIIISTGRIIARKILEIVITNIIVLIHIHNPNLQYLIQIWRNADIKSLLYKKSNLSQKEWKKNINAPNILTLLLHKKSINTSVQMQKNIKNKVHLNLNLPLLLVQARIKKSINNNIPHQIQILSTQNNRKRKRSKKIILQIRLTPKIALKMRDIINFTSVK